MHAAKTLEILSNLPLPSTRSTTNQPTDTMPFPPEPFTINGGCNCRAIRYRISVPEPSFRPTHPFASQTTPPDHPAAYFPMIATDGCNDCRSATASILPTWICAPADMMSVCIRAPPPVLTDHSLSKEESGAMAKLPLPRQVVEPGTAVSTTTNEDQVKGFAEGSRRKQEEETETWHPALSILSLNSPQPIPNSPLRWYISSSHRARTFCNHCGTNLTYAIYPMPPIAAGFPDLFDTLLGTVDRADLERKGPVGKQGAESVGKGGEEGEVNWWMAPERHLWWGLGLEWVKDGVRNGFKGPRHPDFRVSEFED